jgi:hypothetical protein
MSDRREDWIRRRSKLASPPSQHCSSAARKDIKQEQERYIFFPEGCQDTASTTWPVNLRLAALTLSASLPSMSHGLGNTSKNDSAFIMVIDNDEDANTTLPAAPQTLLEKLHQVIDNLPHSVQLGASTDILACFSGDPRSELEEGDEAWEMVDRALNRVIGFGATIEDISRMIQRGEFGMDGMLNWLTICIRELNIDEVLLEMKMERLIEAMIYAYAVDFFFYFRHHI